MLRKYERVAYELLRPGEVAAIRKRSPIAYIPAGSLEWHSFQNPLGCDALKAHAVCSEAALRHGGIVLPPVYQGLLGKGWGPKGWGSFTLGFNTQRTFDALILGIARALVHYQWRVIAGVTGHDVPEQRGGLARAIGRAVKGKRAKGFAVMEGDLQRPEHGLPFWMDHAGAWETSCMLYVCPGRVNLGEFRRDRVTKGEDLDIRGPEGVGGKDPAKYASARLGRRIVEKMGDLIGRKARGMLGGRAG